MNYDRIAILGTGLLGGSLALACREKATLWGRNPERVKIAADLGINATADLAEAVTGAGLIVLAVPVGVMPALIEAALPHLSPGCLVTDVGSVKAHPHHTIGTLLAEKGIPFIGSHPMAGSEKTGVEAADPHLFQNAACILTNEQNIDAAVLAQLETFWIQLGCQVQHMTAAVHDQAVARISHFPHAMSVITSDISLKNKSHEQLAGGGLRDTTRVASGDPAMWAEIMCENRDALIPILHEADESLREMLEVLENSDEEHLRQLLTRVKDRRDASPISS